MQVQLAKQQALSAITGEEPLSVLAKAVKTLDPETLKTLRNDGDVQGAVQQRKDGNAVMALLLTGAASYSLEYLNDEPLSDFSKTLDGEDDLKLLHENQDQPSMNCWQFLMDADVLSGKATQKDIEAFGEKTNKQQKWWEVGAKLTDSFALYVPGESEPSEGDCILLVTISLVEGEELACVAASQNPGHVGVFCGGDIVMNHEKGSRETSQESLSAWAKNTDTSFESAHKRREMELSFMKERGKEKEYLDMNGKFERRQVVMFGPPPWRGLGNQEL